MVLTFIDERRKKLEKATAEARAEGLAEGHTKGHAEGLARGREEVHEVYSAWTAWNRRREDAERRGERFDEPPPSLNGR